MVANQEEVSSLTPPLTRADGRLVTPRGLSPLRWIGYGASVLTIVGIALSISQFSQLPTSDRVYTVGLLMLAALLALGALLWRWRGAPPSSATVRDATTFAFTGNDQLPPAGAPPPVDHPAAARLGFSPPRPLYANAPSETPPAIGDHDAVTEPIQLPVPFDQDPLFALETPPLGITVLTLPKEGMQLALEYEDNYAIHGAAGRFAVTDGVTTSFVPRPYARIIARTFVDQPDVVRDQESCEAWLAQCANTWLQWMRDRWVPTIARQRRIAGKPPVDYTEQIDVRGAQATLIGCAVGRGPSSPQLMITSVGDAQCFLVRPDPQQGGMRIISAFPLQDPAQFNPNPATLGTRHDLIATGWSRMTSVVYDVDYGDLIILTSDALGQWLLRDPIDHLRLLLATSSAPPRFAELIAQQRQLGTLEDDDITAVLVPLALYRPRQQ